MKEVSHEFVKENWLRKDDVKETLGKSLTAITRLEKQGKLRKVVIDGLNYYDPQSVEEVQADPEIKLGTDNGTNELLTTMRTLVDLVKTPREKIDELLFRMLERQDAAIDKLWAKLEAGRDEIEKAKDGSLEREAALKMVATDSEVKKLAGMRMVDTISKLITGMGGNGLKLTPDQLRELVALEADGEGAFLNKQQKEHALNLIKEAETKIQAGKAAAAQVAEQAEQTPPEAAHAGKAAAAQVAEQAEQTPPEAAQ